MSGVSGVHIVAGWFGDGWQAIANAARRVRRGFRLVIPERLLIAPQCLVPGDPVTAVDLFEGQFLLAGRTVQARGVSPFSVVPPNAAWSRELHSFVWLKHFRDSEFPEVRAQARALVDDWLRTPSAHRQRSAWMPEVVARRMLSWLTQSPVLLTDADHGFFQRLMRELARMAFVLEGVARRNARGPAQLQAAIALATYTLCAVTRENDWKRSSKWLAQALSGGILADGTPMSRNPADALALAADLLSLRTAYGARGRATPPELQAAIERLLGFIRLMRHSTGEIALFNGMGVTEFDLVGAILQFDDARGQPLPAAAKFGGYHRLERGPSVVLVDAGIAPARAASLSAHAGVTSFEFSSAGERIIVNCGAPRAGLTDLRQALRETPAHSTLSVPGMSAARFKAVRTRDHALERVLLDSAERPFVERDPEGADDRFAIEHEGYLKLAGFAHRRALTLVEGGHALRGEEVIRLDPRRGRSVPGPLLLRFHLHPRVMPTRAADGFSAQLRLGDGSIWEFDAGGLPLTLEDSVFFGGLASQRQTRQIVVTIPTGDVTAIWSLIRKGR